MALEIHSEIGISANLVPYIKKIMFFQRDARSLKVSPVRVGPPAAAPSRVGWRAFEHTRAHAHTRAHSQTGGGGGGVNPMAYRAFTTLYFQKVKVAHAHTQRQTKKHGHVDTHTFIYPAPHTFFCPDCAVRKEAGFFLLLIAAAHAHARARAHTAAHARAFKCAQTHTHTHANPQPARAHAITRTHIRGLGFLHFYLPILKQYKAQSARRRKGGGGGGGG